MADEITKGDQSFIVALKLLNDKRVETEERIAILEARVEELESKRDGDSSVMPPISGKPLSKEENEELNKKKEELIYLKALLIEINQEIYMFDTIFLIGVNRFSCTKQELVEKIIERPHVQFFSSEEYAKLSTGRKLSQLIESNFEFDDNNNITGEKNNE